ncbi:MAG: nuclear transport factor 2 family protein, partial [Myxococcota bacterium]
MDQGDREDLLDRMEVSRTLYGYAHGVDRRDWESFRDCFCDEVEIDLSSYNGNPPVKMAVEDWVQGVRAGLSGFDATQHISANLLVEIDGDRAHATSDVQASHML